MSGVNEPKKFFSAVPSIVSSPLLRARYRKILGVGVGVGQESRLQFFSRHYANLRHFVGAVGAVGATFSFFFFQRADAYDG